MAKQETELFEDLVRKISSVLSLLRLGNSASFGRQYNIYLKKYRHSKF